MIAEYRRTHSPSQSAWSKGRRLLGAILHSSNELSELLQDLVGMMTAHKYRPGHYYYYLVYSHGLYTFTWPVLPFGLG